MENGITIKELIDESGLKSLKVQGELGISKTTLSKWKKQNTHEQIEQVKMAIRKSQIGDGNHYDNKADKELIKILKDMVNTQKETIVFQREELKEWRKRCEDCQKNVKQNG